MTTTTMTQIQAEMLNAWTDAGARIGGVVAVDSRCACGQEAWTRVNSERWGVWDTCDPCGESQLAVLHSPGYWQPGNQVQATVLAEAARCIQLDTMLGGAGASA